MGRKRTIFRTAFQSTASLDTGYLRKFIGANVIATLRARAGASSKIRRPKIARPECSMKPRKVNRMGERRLYLVALPWSSALRTLSELENIGDAFLRIELRQGSIHRARTAPERHRGAWHRASTLTVGD